MAKGTTTEKPAKETATGTKTPKKKTSTPKVGLEEKIVVPLKNKKSENKAKAEKKNKDEKVDTEKDPNKKREAPKAWPPKSVIQRIAKKNASGKNFQSSSHRVAQNLVVQFARNVFRQALIVLANRKGKTLTPKDLQVLAGITEIAGFVPDREELEKMVEKFEEAIRTNPAFVSKKARRNEARSAKKEGGKKAMETV